MKIGYARESINGLPLDAQLAELKDCDTVFSDKATDSEEFQPKLKACIAILNEGDTLVVTQLDRLATSGFFLTQVAGKLHKVGADLVSLDDNIDTREKTDKTFELLAAIANIEAANPHQAHEGFADNSETELRYDQIEEMQYRIACGGNVADLCDEYNITTEKYYQLTE